MNSVKSSWKAFLANKELMYVGSVFEKSVEEIEVILDGLEDKPFEVNRTYVSGVTDIKFKTANGSISHLGKRGKVFNYKNYVIISNEADGNNIIVYRVS